MIGVYASSQSIFRGRNLGKLPAKAPLSLRALERSVHARKLCLAFRARRCLDARKPKDGPTGTAPYCSGPVTLKLLRSFLALARIPGGALGHEPEKPLAAYVAVAAPWPNTPRTSDSYRNSNERRDTR